MKISEKDWKNYISRLRKVNDLAAQKVADYMTRVDVNTAEGMKQLLDYSYAIATRYGEAATELACQMYDAVATVSKVSIPSAEPAETATYGEVVKAVKGKMFDTKDPSSVGSAVGRLVKMAGVDTTMKNALRDGAEWAWIPSGDTCAFCLMLASRGWQKASRNAIRRGHAEHIHHNCDCTYQIRFDESLQVEGYDPDALYDEYIGAGETRQERLNTIRRKLYAKNPDYYRAQKRAAYARRMSAKIPDSEGQFETVILKDGVGNQFPDQERRMARAHSYPDNEGMFENNPRPRDDGKQTDIIKPRNIMKEMNRSDAGREALRFINEKSIPVTLLYNVDVKPSLMGEYDPIGRRIFIYASNTQSAKETAITVIHEATHARLGGTNTRKNEVICRLEEIKHKNRDNSLTFKDIKNTIITVNRHEKYSKLSWK